MASPKRELTPPGRYIACLFVAPDFQKPIHESGFRLSAVPFSNSCQATGRMAAVHRRRPQSLRAAANFLPPVPAADDRYRLFLPAGRGPDLSFHRHGTGIAKRNRFFTFRGFRKRHRHRRRAVGHARTRPCHGGVDGRGAYRRRHRRRNRHDARYRTNRRANYPFHQPV